MSSKASLLLIPGLLCTAELWAAQRAALSGQAEILVPDHTRFSSVGEIARAILAEAPDRFSLAGLSMGGYIVFEMLRQAPGRIERLALLDTKAAADTPDQVQRRRDFMALAKRGRFKGVTPQLLPFLLARQNLENETLRQVIFRMAEQVGVDGFLRQQQAIIDRPDSRGDLGRINCPTLVLCGAEDSLTPVDGHRDMAAAIPGARLAIVDGAGHLAPLEQPDVVTAHLRDWLGWA